MSLRRTALTRRTELRRRTPMSRGHRELAARATKTARRGRDTGPTVSQRKVVADRAGHCCEVCGLALHDGTTWIRTHSFHHRQPRGMGGRGANLSLNSPGNLLLLCGSGITGCHGRVESRRTEAYLAGWLVHSFQESTAIPVTVWWSPTRLLLTEDGHYEAVA